jgi:hypothetical protein
VTDFDAWQVDESGTVGCHDSALHRTSCCRDQEIMSTSWLATATGMSKQRCM